MSKVFTDTSRQVKSEIDRALDIAMTEVGMSVIAEAKPNTPVKSGFLRDNNEYKTNTGAGTLAVGNPDGHSVKVGDLAPYALSVHHGTSRLAARPWLWNAISSKASFIMNILIRRLKK